MQREEIVRMVHGEIERLTRVLELLEQDGSTTSMSTPLQADRNQALGTGGGRGKRSAEVRAKMALAQQKRHKLRKAAAKKAAA